MTAAIVFSLLAQAGAPPALPPGTTPAFAQTALLVEARLAAGDVPGAREAARALPLRRPRIAWADDEALPSNLRAARADGLKRVVEAWARGANGPSGFVPTVETGAADIVVGFAPVLPEGEDGLPAPIRVEPGLPFRATIGLTRGKPGEPLTPAEMNMEVAYALGRYLGVNDSPFNGTSMHQDPRPGLTPTMPQMRDAHVAVSTLALADKLRAAVEVGKPLGLVAPSLSLPVAELDLGEIEQGKPLHGAFLIANAGKGTLEYRLDPDCGCFSLPAVRPVAPGSNAKVDFEINTHDFVGGEHKTLLLRTNDPARPSVEIPVSFRSLPAYRLFHPGGENVVVPDAGGTYDLFLLLPPGSKIHPTDARWDGVDAKLTWDEWQGPLADPDMQEGALLRKGWRFRVRIPATIAPGHRTPGSLTIVTDSPQFGTLTSTLYAQRGIVALPESIYLGDAKPGSETLFLVSRPNAPFKILSVDAGPLKATWHDVRGGTEYRVNLSYPGGSPKGDLLVPVKIRTDDPKHPLVEALVTGNVK